MLAALKSVDFYRFLAHPQDTNLLRTPPGIAASPAALNRVPVRSFSRSIGKKRNGRFLHLTKAKGAANLRGHELRRAAGAICADRCMMGRAGLQR